MNRLSLAFSATALAVAVLGLTPLGEAAGETVSEIVLPRGSVGTTELRDGSVTAAKVKDRSLLARDFKPGQVPRGPAGPQGPPGTIDGVAASGDLACAYPAPTLAPNAIASGDSNSVNARSGNNMAPVSPKASCSCSTGRWTRINGKVAMHIR